MKPALDKLNAEENAAAVENLTRLSQDGLRTCEVVRIIGMSNLFISGKKPIDTSTKDPLALQAISLVEGLRKRFNSPVRIQLVLTVAQNLIFKMVGNTPFAVQWSIWDQLGRPTQYRFRAALARRTR